MSGRRRRNAGSGTFIVFILAILGILGIYFVQTGSNPTDVVETAKTALPNIDDTTATVFNPDSATSATPDPSAQPPLSGLWEVYFTDPLNINDPGQWQNSIEGRLIEKINAAQNSIHIVSFEFDLTPVAEALIAARQRGVDVRWVTDDEFGLESDTEPGHGQFAIMQDAGIEVRADTRSALMHNKFWIFDGQILWTGSTNITENGVFVQDNNTIVIQSPELAAIYEREFQEMWDGQFGPRSPSQLSEQSIIVNGMSVQVIFTSEDPAIEQSIIPVVNGATRSIRFLAFSFTDFPLADSMIKRSQQGVDVSGVFDKTQSGGLGSELATLFCAGVPVRKDGNPQFMHNKVIVVDERFVITGSLNYSTNAEESNDENVIIIDNPEIARLYLQDFDRVWAQATDPQSGSLVCP